MKKSNECSEKNSKRGFGILKGMESFTKEDKMKFQTEEEEFLKKHPDLD